MRSDGAIDRWDLDPRSWSVFACRLTGRELTAPEWAESIGDHPNRPACA